VVFVKIYALHKLIVTLLFAFGYIVKASVINQLKRQMLIQSFITEVYVKKLVVFILVSVLLAGTVFAQNRGDRPNRNDRQRAPVKVTVEGVLQLEKGVVAVASGDSVYLVPVLTRYIGFIEGLKEGAKVSVEGSQFRNFIQPVKVTINGKSYDFPEYGKRDNNTRFPQGRNDYPRRMQGRRFNRGGFGGCCW
jgi:hypothetical protein